MVIKRIFAVVDQQTFMGFCEMARAEGIMTAEGRVDLDAALAGLCRAYADGRVRIARPYRKEKHAKPTGVDYATARTEATHV